jgi:DNA-binding XRE family transcriptional regulator
VESVLPVVHRKKTSKVGGLGCGLRAEAVLCYNYSTHPGRCQNPRMKKAKRNKVTPRSPTFIDAYIGAHIRKHRLALHLTQRQLAKKLGVTMQQLQKYETGDNRVSAARLYEICKTLNVGIASIFERPRG